MTLGVDDALLLGVTCMNKKEFWDSRADLGIKAGSNDTVMKYLEMSMINEYVKDGMRILDFGCGNGVTMCDIASRHDVSILGIDFSDAMIDAAERNARSAGLLDRLSFSCGDQNTIKELDSRFDLIYTERCIINLSSWEEQKNTIIDLVRLLKDDGRYVMCESSIDGLREINDMRARLDLDEITPPWHNRYLCDSEVEELASDGAVSLVDVRYFSSTYYLLSRVLNAALAKEQGVEPSYDAPINKLALRLPPIGRFGQGRIWVWAGKTHH